MQTLERADRVHTVVIVGGGYAGVLAANRIQGRAGGAARVVLVSDREEFVHRVRLHELAGGGAPPRYPLAGLLRRGVEHVHGRVERIDADKGQCVVRPCDGGDERALAYDSLVYAVGSTVDVGARGVREHGYSMAGPVEAQRLARRLETLATGSSVVVVGGGLCGVELAAEIAEAHPKVGVTLLCDAVAAGIGEAAVRAVREALGALRVTVIEGVRVDHVDADEVVLDGGRSVPAAVTVWAAGFVVPQLARASGLAVDDRGRLLLDETLRAVGNPNIYGCGDAAVAPVGCNGTGDGPTVMSATTAMPMGAHVADVIVDGLRGEAPRAFRFDYLAWGISVGRRRAVMYLVDRDNRPTGVVSDGGFAAWQKRLLSGYGPFWLRVERWLPGSYVWPGCFSRRSSERGEPAVTALLSLAALSYAGVAVACVVAPQATSRAMGLVAVGPAGMSEYLAVLGGIPAALAATLVDALMRPSRRASAVRLIAWVNLGFVGARCLAIAREGFGGMGATWFALALEGALLGAAVLLGRSYCNVQVSPYSQAPRISTSTSTVEPLTL